MKISKTTIIVLSVIGVLFFTGLGIFNTYTSTFDKDVKLHSSFDVAKGAVETNFNTMVRTLKDQLKVANLSNDKAIEYAKALMEGRYSKGDGTLMKWVTEQNPTLNQTAFDKLMDNIEALRADFEIKQNRVLAIKEQHENLRNSFWSSIWLKGDKAFEYTIISSTKAKEVMKTGNDDTDMFEDVKK